jgi:hypothetical protein
MPWIYQVHAATASGTAVRTVAQDDRAASHGEINQRSSSDRPAIDQRSSRIEQ